ncbi:MAG: hypothetical protein II453_04730 [Alphaproteobacteria bacterium]|nr:hypothetical protein [Alphaproteobacteria bacterium]
MAEIEVKLELLKPRYESFYDEVKRYPLTDFLKAAGFGDGTAYVVSLAEKGDGNKFGRVYDRSKRLEIRVAGTPDLEPGVYSISLLGDAEVAYETKATMSQKQVEDSGGNWDWYQQAKPERYIVYPATKQPTSKTSAEDFLKALLSR